MQYVWEQPSIRRQSTLHRARLKIKFHTAERVRDEVSVESGCERDKENEREGDKEEETE